MTSHVAYPKSHFVSLIGEAATSTVVPYLGYLKKFGTPLSINLLSTPQVSQFVPGLAAQLGELSPGVPIEVLGVSGPEGSPAGPTVEQAYRDLEDRLGTLAVNMMGGTKRASLGGLFALRRPDHVFVQISEERFLVSRLAAGTVHTESLVMGSELAVDKCLDLQRIEWRIDHEPPWDLKGLCHRAGVPIPDGALFNVVMGGHRVDCLWSAGNNVLHLLLISPDRHLDGPEALAAARRIETLASTKWWTNGLFSRRIIVLEGLAYNVERFEHEVPGLVRSYRVDWRSDELTGSAREKLMEVFHPPKSPPPAPIKRPELDLAPVPTLVTAMGRMSDATMLAIASHGLPQVVLVYTPQDEWVAHMVEVYREKADRLGLQRVLAAPTDYTAANIPAHLPAELAPLAEVNITPGTKPQGAALGLWAKTHGAQAWALDRDRLRRLDRPAEPRPVRGLNLQTRLDLTLEARITDYGWNPKSPDWPDAPLYPRMLEFMGLAIDEGRAGDLLRRDILIGGWGLTRLDGGSGGWEFRWPRTEAGPAGAERLVGGHWYERLAAKAVDGLNSLGRTVYDVSCSVAVSIPGHSRFLTERDVLVATSRAHLFMISCKSAVHMKGRIFRRTLEEVEAMAKTLGRFVIPVLLWVSTAEPAMAGEVMVMGWTTLCRPDALAKALDMAARSVHG